jgi:hypothetical protein
MANTDLAVRIATIFDSSGLKKADKSLGGFDKGLKKLAQTLGTALSVSTVVAFGKASVKAFVEEEKSAALLANTMKNLGVAFAVPQMETFISQLSQTAGVADDVLRPAMQKLLSQTGDYFKSQEILTQAIEVSRGSGVELATVVSDLSAAYVGNTKGLKKYNLGLTQAELKTMKFADVQKKLNAQFNGSSAAYLETYAGKMEVLKTAAGEAQETIGKGLVDALALLAGDTSIQGVADQMQDLAKYTSNVIVGIADLTAKIKNIVPGGSNLNFKNLLPPQVRSQLELLDYFAKRGEKSANSKMQNPSVQMFMTDQNNARLAREKLKIDKEIVKNTKANTAELKKQAAEKKQSALFDLEKIGLVAALQGKITAEEKLRLELQLALLTGNDALATKLSGQLANSIDATGKLAKDLTTLPDAKNPFAAWSAYLDGVIAKARLAASFGGVSTGSTARGESFASLTPTVQDLITGGGTGGRAGVDASGNVYVTVNGSVVSDQDLVIAIENGLQKRSLSGAPSVIGRISGMFGG